MRALAAVKPGMRYRDVGDIISSHAQGRKCSVIKTYCGHGICDLFHCAPNIPHYRKNKAKGVMQARRHPFYSDRWKRMRVSTGTAVLDGLR